jgi:hypothetical protein
MGCKKLPLIPLKYQKRNLKQQMMFYSAKKTAVCKLNNPVLF